MSKHRKHANTETPVAFGSETWRDQVVAVEAAPDTIHLTVTPEAAVELARVLVQYGSAVRTEKAPALSTSQQYDPALWHDVGLALNAAVVRTTPHRMARALSRYVAPRRVKAPLIALGGGR